jgi:hypothetical protein
MYRIAEVFSVNTEFFEDSIADKNNQNKRFSCRSFLTLQGTSKSHRLGIVILGQRHTNVNKMNPNKVSTLLQYAACLILMGV